MSSRLGVIGGMGPAATAFLYEEIIAHTKAGSDQEHIDMVILSHASMPDRTKAILTGNEEDVLAAFESDVRIMEAAEVSHIVIPCNTAHYFYDKVQAMTKIPFIHMVRETVTRAVSEYHPADGRRLRIGVMATDGTVRAGVYGRECDAAGCEAVYPSDEAQQDVMSLIYDDIKAGRDPDRSKFKRAYEDLKKNGSDCVILACTELSVYTKYDKVPTDCLDAMSVLVKEAIIRSGAEYI